LKRRKLVEEVWPFIEKCRRVDREPLYEVWVIFRGQLATYFASKEAAEEDAASEREVKSYLYSLEEVHRVKDRFKL